MGSSSGLRFISTFTEPTHRLKEFTLDSSETSALRRTCAAATSALVAIAVLALPTDAAASHAYKTELGCGEGAKGSSCAVGSGVGALFKAKNGHRTRYVLCIKNPDGAKSCDKHKTNANGVDVIYGFDNGPLGRYRATWKVGGEFAGHDEMTLLIGD
jgi:hypothetical protein